MKLLVTARDAGAAFNILEIVKTISKDPTCNLSIYTQMPATKIFENAGIRVNSVNLPSVTAHDINANSLLAYSKDLINHVKPTVILSGLSTPLDAGLDEAIISIAKRKIPTFVMQDFWGEANNFFGATADYYLVLDEEAIKLTEERYDTVAFAIGSPRHASYQLLNILELRNQLRHELNLSVDIPIIGYFGQALHHLQGYQTTIMQLIHTLKNLNINFHVVYRKHPRESTVQADNTIRLLRDLKVNFTHIQHEKIEYSLLLCDIVCSLFSNCSYDASYLNYFSSHPLLVPMILSFEKTIRDYFKTFIHLDELPYLKNGLAIGVYEDHNLAEKLRYALSNEGRENVWRASKILKNPVQSTTSAIEIIKNIIMKNL